MDAVRAAIDSHLPALGRTLQRHLREVLRDYMWEFVAKRHEDFSKSDDPSGYIFLLLRRLALSVVGPMAGKMGEELGIELEGSVSGGVVHPMRFYVIPPFDDLPHVTGDIYFGNLQAYAPSPPFEEPASGDSHGETGGAEPEPSDNYWVLMTPACDLVIQSNGVCKADNILLCRAEELKSQKEYLEWKTSGSGTKKTALENLLKNRRKGSGVQPERYHYLPGVFDLPDLIVDFQQVISVPRKALSPDHDPALSRMATLDDPFAAEMVARFTNYLNRVGSPDLDIAAAIKRLS